MTLPFDLEDIVGVALADVLRRAFWIVVVTYGGGLVAMMGLGLGSVVAGIFEYGSIDFDLAEFNPWKGLFIPLAPFVSAWAVLYVPTVIALGFYCVRSDEVSLGWLAWFTAGIGTLQVLAAWDPDWFNPGWYGIPVGGGVADPDKLGLIRKGVALPIVLGCAGGAWFGARILDEKRRVEAESHLMGVTIENEERRRHLRDEHGIEIADHDDGFLDQS